MLERVEMSQDFARTRRPPYYAVIFTSQRNERDEDGYEATARTMFELAAKQPGYLGAEHARGTDGFGITVAYFTDEAAIRAWRENAEHRAAQRLGIARWYSRYDIRVAKVEREYDGPDGR
jgi:heme-degrading monooxygenase HmoA